MDNKINSLTIHKLTERTLIENLKPFLFFGGLFVALSLLVVIVFGPEEDGLLVNLIESLIYAKLAVLVHRTVLLKEKDVIHAFKWGLPEIIYMLSMVAVMIAITLIVFVTTSLFLIISPTGSVSGGMSVVTIVFFSAIALLAGYFGSRIALAFPSIAIGQSFTLSEIWHKSKPHTMTLFWLIIVFPILANVVPAAVFLLPFPEWLLGVLILAMYAIIVIYCITLLSHCYHEIMGEPKNEQKPMQELTK